MSRRDAAFHVSRLTGHDVGERTLRNWESQGLLPRKGASEDGESDYDLWDVTRACAVAYLRLGSTKMEPQGIAAALAGFEGLQEKLDRDPSLRVVASECGVLAVPVDVELALERVLSWNGGRPGGFYAYLPIRSWRLGKRFEPTAGPRGETVN